MEQSQNSKICPYRLQQSAALKQACKAAVSEVSQKSKEAERETQGEIDSRDVSILIRENTLPARSAVVFLLVIRFIL